MTPIDLIKQGRIIAEARNRKNMTQKELAKRLHVSEQAISNWENGKNNIDKGIIEPLNRLLGTSISSSGVSKEVSKKMTPLKQIESITELKQLTKELVNQIEFDQAFAPTTKKMLYLLFNTILGYEIYYVDYIKNWYSEGEELDWSVISCDLRSIINPDDLFTSPNYYPPTNIPSGLIAERLYFMSYNIGGELFEDLEESSYGWKNDYVQQVGRYGESCGYDLLNILPESSNVLMVCLKSAMLSLADLIDEFYQK